MKKTITKFALIALTLLCTVPAYADWRYGLKASYDNTGATWTIDGKRYSTRNISGFSLGPVFGYEFIDYFSVQSGLYFSMNGFATGEHGFIKNYEYVVEETIRLYYLQLPVYAVGQYPLKDDAILLLEVGPHFACGVADHYTASAKFINAEGEQEESASNIAFGQSLSRFNVAMHVGIGAEYLGARLMVGYDFGLFDTVLTEDTELRSGGFTVSIGYMF